MNDLMVDLETLGCRANATITQIGACYFDRNTGIITEKFRENIRIQDCIDRGFSIDGDTIKFWMEQSTATWLCNAVDLRTALEHFRYFAKPCDVAWAHAGFDFPILFTAYKTLNIGLPFHYRAVRDLRTLVDLAGVKYKDTPRDSFLHTHDALDDCIHQVKYACECFKRLREKEK